MSGALSYKWSRFVSEFRRLLASREGRITIDRRGLRIGQGCAFRTSGSGVIQVGEAVHLEERVLLQSEGRVEIGPWVYINRDTVIVALEAIDIGAGTRIAERVSIRDHDHRFDQTGRPIREQGYVCAPIRVGRECWIGCNAVILKGVNIGDGAVIGAGAVVTKDVPAHSVAVGVPARVVRSLPSAAPPQESHLNNRKDTVSAIP